MNYYVINNLAQYQEIFGLMKVANFFEDSQIKDHILEKSPIIPILARFGRGDWMGDYMRDMVEAQAYRSGMNN